MKNNLKNGKYIIFNKNKDCNQIKLNVLHYLFAGAIAGGIASTVTVPMDVIKTRLQTQSTLGIKRFTFFFLKKIFFIIILDIMELFMQQKLLFMKKVF